MTDISPEDSELIRRYLAKGLTDREVELVETRIVEDPGFRNEVELTEALRGGLRELQNRREIAPLLSHRHSLWRLPRYALAASVAAVALGVASFLFFEQSGVGTVETVVATLRFEQTRGAAGEPDVSWRETGVPTQLEMQFDAGLTPGRNWQVAIERVTDGVAWRVTDATATLNADGLAVATLDSAAFPPGDYRITLSPNPPAESQAPIVYALRISGQP